MNTLLLDHPEAALLERFEGANARVVLAAALRFLHRDELRYDEFCCAREEVGDALSASLGAGYCRILQEELLEHWGLDTHAIPHTELEWAQHFAAEALAAGLVGRAAPDTVSTTQRTLLTAPLDHALTTLDLLGLDELAVLATLCADDLERDPLALAATARDLLVECCV